MQYGNQVIDPVRVMKIAQNGGVPVATLLPTVLGEESFVWQGRKLSLQRVMGDRTCDISNEAHVAEFARTLGRLHQATSRYEVAGTNWSIVTMSEDYLNSVRCYISSKPSSSEGLMKLTDTADKLTAGLSSVKDKMRAGGWDELPLIPVHGDYHHHNVRFSGDDLVAVVDFDQARSEPRLYDIAYALGHLFGTYWPSDGSGFSFWTSSRSMSESQFAFWMTQYLETGPSLSNREWHLLPLACAAVWPRIIEDDIPDAEEGLLKTDSVIGYMDTMLARFARPIIIDNVSPNNKHNKNRQSKIKT